MLSSAQAGHRLLYMHTPDNALLILGFSQPPTVSAGAKGEMAIAIHVAEAGLSGIPV